MHEPQRTGEPAVPSEGVRLRVTTPKTPLRINPRVYGLVCAEMITKGFLDEPEYVEAIAELQLKVLQYPGGSASYWHHPTGQGGLNARPEEVKKSAKGEASRWMEQTKGPDWFERYLALLKQSNAEALFIANVMHGTPEELDLFLQRLRREKIGIAAVALGQEMHLSPGVVGLTLEEYLRRIGPYIRLLKDKYPGVLVAVPATPVGRVTEKKRQRLHGWNQALAQVSGVDAFTQYGWTEFGGIGGRNIQRPAEQVWPGYRDFVLAFPTEQLPIYQRDFGPDKKFLMTQWGTHQDQNSPVQGVHLAHMYFFLTRYNAAHNDYFAAATLSVPLAGVEGKGGRLPGIPYRDKVTLYAAYLYSKPFRHLYDGQQRLLDIQVTGGGEVQALAAVGPDGRRLVYVLNPGPRRPLSALCIDTQDLHPATRVHIEAAYAAPGEQLAPVAVLVGEQTLRDVVLEPWSLTLIQVAANKDKAGNTTPAKTRAALPAGTKVDQLADLTEETVVEDEPKMRPAARQRPAGNRPQLPSPPGITEKEFVYKQTPQGELRLFVTYPADWKASDRRPAVVFFSGGAWANSLPNQFKDRAEYFAGRGMVAVRVDYRAFRSHGTGPDKAVEDARSALRWVRARAAQLGIDPHRIAAAGSSAGGHLAACTATPVAPDDPADDTRISCAPNALMMVNCVADFMGMEDSEKFRQRVPGGKAMADRLSPFRHLGKHTPPTLILDGDQDRWFDLAKSFVQKLKEHGVRAELWIAPDQGHPFTGFSPWREASIAKMDEFLASLGWLTGPPTIAVPAGGQFQAYKP
jgi:acetyl esterase/lipase